MNLRLTKELEAKWPAYRLVMERACTLGELETMSIVDVEEANEALDAWQEAQRKLAEMS